ncbi:LysR family transcriptional regulator [Methylobacterium oryzihabitans]|jgi:LysR family nitrogen assimilation transcriptional regulator|uniref:LysR family transcriptional regulator n=1 Tax=Methylobacterium oryzihabitans TaxID=2499852 RepID=A0A437NW60_9HYPH|nr:LysR substrate-binding domain-containing protein [Methylobacterium oryzihabitans]RVU14236.1 LysR family transcriptional regulator [Methylobacterium oryzihabitans]
MDFKQLKAFATLAEFGSFSRAGAVLSVAQPVLSRQIKALEEELGIELVYRNGRGIVLTEAGKLLHGYAGGVLDTVQRATSEVMALRSSPRGTIAIGMPPSVGAVLTVPLVCCFRAEFPEVAMRIVEGFSGHILEWLLTGKIDVAVLYNAPRTSNLRAEPLLQEEISLLGPANDPLGLGDRPVPAARLAEIPMILPGRPHGLRLLIDSCLGEAGIAPSVILEVDAMPSTLSLVEQGVGYTLLSYGPARHLIQAGRMRQWSLTDPVLTRELILATTSQRPTTVATRALAGMVRRQVHALVRDGLWLSEPA